VVGDSNDAGGVAEEVEKEIVERRGRNWGKELIFSQLWTQIFLRSGHGIRLYL